jgi:heterodisulfide reductase subunit C
MVLLGMRQQVLSSDFIWLCSQCYTCYAHCPQNVKFTEVMIVLRDMAVKEGYVNPSFINRIKEIDNLSQRLRHRMVLSAVGKKAEDASVDPARLAAEALKEI